MEQNINTAVHQIILDHIKPDHICVDATCGNGHDTVFLASHSAKVYAFDIQAQAIEATTKALNSKQLTNVIVLHQSHDTIQNVVDDKIDIVMYNLGYLPYSDRSITTSPDTTIKSLKQAMGLLRLNGLISITLYIGHDGGAAEATAIEAFVKTLDKHKYTVIKYEHINRKRAPYALFIERIQ